MSTLLEQLGWDPFEDLHYQPADGWWCIPLQASNVHRRDRMYPDLDKLERAGLLRRQGANRNMLQLVDPEVTWRDTPKLIARARTILALQGKPCLKCNGRGTYTSPSGRHYKCSHCAGTGCA